MGAYRLAAKSGHVGFHNILAAMDFAPFGSMPAMTLAEPPLIQSNISL
jgi:hypothetical protein